MRCYFRKLILLFILPLFIFSCNGSPGIIFPDYSFLSESSPSTDAVTVLHDLYSSELDALDVLVGRFNNENEYGIRVILKKRSVYTAPEDSNIILTSASESEKLLKAGKTSELSPFFYHPLWGEPFGRMAFYAVVRGQTDYWDWSRKISSVPILMDAGVLVINEDLLAESGYGKFPGTWFFFSRLVKKVSRLTGFPAFGIELNAQSYVSLINGRGGSILRPNRSAYSFNNPTVIGAVSLVKSLIKRNAVLYPAASYENQTSFISGTMLCSLAGIEALKYYDTVLKSVNPELGWSAVPVPSRRLGNSFVLDADLTAAIMKGEAGEQLSSWIFIHWLTEEAQQIYLSSQTGKLPVRADALKNVLATEPEETGLPEQWYDIAGTILNSHKEPAPVFADYPAVAGKFENMIKRSFDGGFVFIEAIRLNREVAKYRKSFEEDAAE